MFFSPVKSQNKCKTNKNINRPLSSFSSRGRFFKANSFNNNNNVISPINDKKNIIYKIDNNHDNDYLQSTNLTNTKNNYNKLRISDFRGKNRYSNFTVFLKREMNINDIKITPKNFTQRLNRQKSAIQLNLQNIFREGKLYLTDLIKKPQKLPTRNSINYLSFNKRKVNTVKNNFNKYNNNKNNNNKSNIESKIINNYKYKNINLLRKIDTEKKIKKISFTLEEKKNDYLATKKMEYASISEKNSKEKKNYVENLNNIVENIFSIKLKKDKYEINREEIESENQYINYRMSSVKYSNELYNNFFSNKFHNYIKFLWRKIDKYDKDNHFLLNKVVILRKEIGQIKKRINFLSETKKIYNKFILLQIQLKKKTMNLPEYYEFILNHTLPEGIEYCDGIISKEEVKEIFGFKENIIYKNYETFNSQFKTYENENRDLLEKLGNMNKDILLLIENKNKVIEEGKQLVIYFNNKIKERTKEKSSLLKKNHLLMKEKNNLLTEIKYNFTNVKNISKKKKNKFSSNVIQDYNTLYQEVFTSSSQYTNNTFNKNGRKAIDKKGIKSIKKNNYISPSIKQSKHLDFQKSKEKSTLSIDEEIILNINVSYEAKDKNAPHSNLYLKVRELYLQLKNFIRKDNYFQKVDYVTTEIGLIVKILSKIEIGMNAFLEKIRALEPNNKEIMEKMAQKIDKERKIIKGEKYREMLKQKNENMKLRVEEKANRFYFLQKTKKRNISANINKKNKNKKVKKIVEKSEYELLVEYFNEN